MKNYNVTVRSMSKIYHIFKACARNDPFPSFHKIELFPKLCYVLDARSVDLLYGKLVQFCLLHFQQ